MAKGFQSLGHQTLTASGQEGKIQQSALDYRFNDMKFKYFKGVPIPSLRKRLYSKYGPPRERILQKALKECDAFVFVSFSFRNDLSDLKILREAGKKIVFIFTGTDVRWLPAVTQDFEANSIPTLPYENYDQSPESLRQRLTTMRMAERYCDGILSLPNQSQLALRPYHVYRQVVDPEDFTNMPRQRKRPLIVHAASNSAVKGSKYVERAFENLKAKGLEFDYKLVSGLPRNEIIKVYEECDVLVGQMFIPSGGFQERELLACGKVVLSSMLARYPDFQLVDNPIVDVNPDTLETELEQIIPDVERRQALADRARPYMMKEHSPEVFCQKIIDIVEERQKPEIVPSFFRNDFNPQPENVEEFNRQTELVKHCSWYSEIESGTREGLKF